jgi:hypothetical protein
MGKIGRQWQERGRGLGLGSQKPSVCTVYVTVNRELRVAEIPAKTSAGRW